ncbi:phosphomannomutase/phosphoglucomutase [Marinimicrobium sp. ABcell2]|uniref:phosphomannomutase/phosphoglucomutase n=1 Tax=Marinimicrobium sp. ABcell2 TaxID=3069751 RepID=UPI0027B5EE23|nr:phosphomannomutase/phosphoglucomutase [Marinimicrobium sp. ABcell2]MDQ2076708.1 phosphomannomutase/phosphoglucomutase [Marinimicrobium sp. ABcell2]
MAKAKSNKRAAKSTNRAHLKLLSLLVVGVLIFNALLGYWLYERMVVEVERERLQALTEQEAQSRARLVQLHLNDLRERMAVAAQTPGLEQAIAEPDPELRADFAKDLEGQFPSPLAVRLIPRGSAQLERDHEAPIRFAELDLIRRAERRDTTHPEMARVENEWQLHLIKPLPTDSAQPVTATLLVTLDAGEMRTQLTPGDPDLGQTRLLQQISGSGNQLLAQRGFGLDSPTHEVAIPNSHWRLAFTPSEALTLQAQELPGLWLLIMAATTGGGLAIAWFASRLLTRERGRTSEVSPASIPASSNKETGRKQEESNQDLTNPLYHDQDILDITVADEDEDILGLDTSDTRSAAKPTPAPAQSLEFSSEIFRSYDIRGLANSQLTLELAEHIGRALGSEAQEQGETHMIVARDGRSHSPELSRQLIKGITQTGCHVIDLGIVPSPLMYFATEHLSDTNSGVMVTASHNPAEYNGFKMIINGVTLADEAVQDIRARVSRQQYLQGAGETESRDIVPAYIERIFSDVALMGEVSIVIDAGNAVTGIVAPQLFEELGCHVTPLYCDLDGTFPNHDPDPTQEKNLRDLIDKVQEVNADVGVAFDGDGDRLVVVTPKGRIIWPDHLLMLFARDILSRHPGADVVFDVKCSRQLNQLITSYGGRPIMWKTGHSPMKSKMVETGALIGGEYSGHIFIKDRWYGFDDGMYTMARLLEIITLRDQGIDEAFEAFPVLPSTPELKIPVAEKDKFALVEKLIKEGDFKNGKASTIDGLKVDFDKGWGLVRASNTSAALTLRFEAESETALKTIQQLFKRELLKVDSSLPIDF